MFQLDSNILATVFGSVLGAIVTIGAVILSIRLVRPKIKVSAALMSAHPNMDIRALDITVSNHGRADIVVTTAGICLNGSKRVVLTDDCGPMTLQPYGSRSYYWFGHHLAYGLAKPADDHLININKRLKVFVNDSLGKCHYAKARFTAKQLLDFVVGKA